jgi:hypothetical protein
MFRLFIFSIFLGPILTYLDPDPLTQLYPDPDPKHCVPVRYVIIMVSVGDSTVLTYLKFRRTSAGAIQTSTVRRRADSCRVGTRDFSESSALHSASHIHRRHNSIHLKNNKRIKGIKIYGTCFLRCCMLRIRKYFFWNRILPEQFPAFFELSSFLLSLRHFKIKIVVS